MLSQGSTQVRGTLRWKWRRLRTGLRQGRAELSRLPVVFGNAIPKSGSKLLFNILLGFQELGPFVDTGLNEIKPFRDGAPTPQAWINAQLESLGPGDIRLGYLAWDPETEARLCRKGWAVYQILRDPRDTVISQIFYATEMHKGHALHDYLRSLPDMEARIEAMIQGIPEGRLRRANIREQFDRYTPWMKRPEVHLVRYEDLVGRPEQELGLMLGHLRRLGFASGESDEALVPRLRARMAPAKSETFRKGGAGGWRQYFTDRNRAQFERVAGDLLRELGYEA
jgi:hypothetical protein